MNSLSEKITSGKLYFALYGKSHYLSLLETDSLQRIIDGNVTEVFYNKELIILGELFGITKRYDETVLVCEVTEIIPISDKLGNLVRFKYIEKQITRSLTILEIEDLSFFKALDDAAAALAKGEEI